MGELLLEVGKCYKVFDRDSTIYAKRLPDYEPTYLIGPIILLVVHSERITKSTPRANVENGNRYNFLHNGQIYVADFINDGGKTHEDLYLKKVC